MPLVCLDASLCCLSLLSRVFEKPVSANSGSVEPGRMVVLVLLRWIGQLGFTLKHLPCVLLYVLCCNHRAAEGRVASCRQAACFVGSCRRGQLPWTLQEFFLATLLQTFHTRALRIHHSTENTVFCGPMNMDEPGCERGPVFAHNRGEYSFIHAVSGGLCAVRL